MARDEKRPCLVGKNLDQRALFHRWAEVAQIVPPSPMMGGHGGGVVKDVVALVEMEDGTIRRVDAHYIRFIDSCAEFEKHCFQEGGKHE